VEIKNPHFLFKKEGSIESAMDTLPKKGPMQESNLGYVGIWNCSEEKSRDIYFCDHSVAIDFRLKSSRIASSTKTRLQEELSRSARPGQSTERRATGRTGSRGLVLGLNEAVISENQVCASKV
jgi:hypothetical protein